jgi:hypothetical protein
MIEYHNNQSGGGTETTPQPLLRQPNESVKPDTADYLGDSDELDEFAVHHSSDENQDALTNNEQELYGHDNAVNIVDDYFQTQEAGM